MARSRYDHGDVDIPQREREDGDGRDGGHGLPRPAAPLSRAAVYYLLWFSITQTWGRGREMTSPPAARHGYRREDGDEEEVDVAKVDDILSERTQVRPARPLALSHRALRRSERTVSRGACAGEAQPGLRRRGASLCPRTRFTLSPAS
jgi:hypothetical protein